MPETDALILAFDTSGSYCAAVLARGENVVASHSEEMKRGQAERLFPILEDVLAAGEVSWSDLDRIGVGIGPGNFTGIRISVAAARGLSLSLGVPAVGVSTLEAQYSGKPIIARVSAPREQCYIQVFSETIDPPMLTSDENAKELAEVKNLPLGVMLSPLDLVTVIAERAALATKFTPPAPLYIRAADAAPPKDPAPVILA